MKKGDIYYIKSREQEIGCEIYSGRPGVIVSNDKLNQSSGVVEVVFLTTKDKPPLPTHVTIRSAPKISTALCEQVNSVSVERIDSFCGRCTDMELRAIERALLISFDMDGLRQNGISDASGGGNSGGVFLGGDGEKSLQETLRATA